MKYIGYILKSSNICCIYLMSCKSMLGFFNMKVLEVVCKFAVAEGELSRHPVVEGRYGFLNSNNREGRE